MIRSLRGRVSFRARCGLSAAVTLPLFFVLTFHGCRDNTTSVTSSSAIPFRFAPVPGDYVRYNNWKLDEYGYRISSSRFRDSWTVTDTGETYMGRYPVTFVLDSVFGPVSGGGLLIRVDTLYFHISSGSEIEQFGFLSFLLELHLGTPIQPTWDRVASFSLGMSQRWVVGYSDTGRSEPVYGSIESQQDFVTVEVNGTPTLLLSYIVDIDSPDLRVTLWMTDSPSAVLRIRDESTQSLPGRMKEVDAIRSVGR